jgi:hypothetical protein
VRTGVTKWLTRVRWTSDQTRPVRTSPWVTIPPLKVLQHRAVRSDTQAHPRVGSQSCHSQVRRRHGRSLRTITLSGARDALWVCYASALMLNIRGSSAIQGIQTGSVRLWGVVSAHAQCLTVLRICPRETDSVTACYLAVCDYPHSLDLGHHRHGALTVRLSQFSRIVPVPPATPVEQLVVGVDHPIRTVTSCQRGRPSTLRIHGGAPPLTSVLLPQLSKSLPTSILVRPKSYQARRNSGGNRLVARW